MTKDFDLVVIGGGPAGISGANTAAIFGKRVALVEKLGKVGGAGINTGTIPSKTLRETALALSGWRSRKLFGVDLSLRREATVEDFMRHKERVVAHDRKRREKQLRTYKIETFQGVASFVDPNTVRIAPDTLLRGEKILIATGSSPMRPPEFPFEHPRVHDSDEILEIGTLPKTLAVIGAGVIGAEYACTFAALGVEVNLIDGRDSLLSFLDREISQSIEQAMSGNGVNFIWKEKVVRCDAPANGKITLTLTSGATIAVDDVLVAAGRQSNTADLNLSAAGLTPGKRGLIKVDAHCRTEVPHIFAAGDVIGAPALAATSMEQARLAICVAFEFDYKDVVAPILPTGIYTIPEASMAGETEESLKTKGIGYVVGRARYADNPRGQIIGDESGLLKLIFRKDDMRLLGVHVVGEQATELVHLGLIAMMAEAGADLFNRTCFNYPTLGDLYKYATYAAMLKRDGLVVDDSGQLPTPPIS
ncbi:MAG TPA: Si-specific NAD(P)(+) transhydrogenase [Candidatus Udaeobacter sp.]|nr:Si-specific NAD(P)(+) transhydrogenase [Candidatus Udaeobacter sp.]